MTLVESVQSTHGTANDPGANDRKANDRKANDRKANDQGALGPGALNGERFIDSLKDGREVWISGERVEDVTTHPAFTGVIRELARIYDLQHDPSTREAMTFVDDAGVRVSVSYLEPKNLDDLLKRRRNAEIWSRESFGMMGRYPDFCAAITIGFKDVGDELATFDPMFARHAAWHHRWSAHNDLCLGHGLHDPTMDKSKRPEQDPDRCLRVVKERDGGIVVRGARYVTLGPVTHELQIAPTYVLNEREADHAVWFAVPVATPGIRQVCRPSVRGESAADHPAASRFDEQDALVIFDDVFVPWERVFLYRQPEAANRLFRNRVMTWAVYAAAIQLLARMELLVGTGHLMAQTAGAGDRPNVTLLMGELVTYKRIFESIVRHAEVDHVTTPSGLVTPGPMHHQRAFITMVSERLVAIIEQIGTSSLIFQPSAADFDAPQLAPLLERYGAAVGVTPQQRSQLCKLAWDLTGETFGGRQQLYERLHSGDPEVVVRGVYGRYDKSVATSMVSQLLGWDTDPAQGTK
jgi:4-hydroxyphenylacetate 3-monooxygenase